MTFYTNFTFNFDKAQSDMKKIYYFLQKRKKVFGISIFKNNFVL